MFKQNYSSTGFIVEKGKEGRMACCIVACGSWNWHDFFMQSYVPTFLDVNVLYRDRHTTYCSTTTHSHLFSNFVVASDSRKWHSHRKWQPFNTTSLYTFGGCALYSIHWNSGFLLLLLITHTDRWGLSFFASTVVNLIWWMASMYLSSVQPRASRVERNYQVKLWITKWTPGSRSSISMSIRECLLDWQNGTEQPWIIVVGLGCWIHSSTNTYTYSISRSQLPTTYNVCSSSLHHDFLKWFIPVSSGKTQKEQKDNTLVEIGILLRRCTAHS